MAELEEIRGRHETLESLVSTQSTRQMNEIRSQAHRDRGELLGLLEALQEKNGALLMELASCREEVERLKADLGTYMEIANNEIVENREVESG